MQHPNYISACFQSASERNPWVAIDLLVKMAVSAVVILSGNVEGEWGSLFSCEGFCKVISWKFFIPLIYKVQKIDG